MLNIGLRRRAADRAPVSTAAVRIFVYSALFLCTLTVAAVVVVSIYVPPESRGNVITTVVGITSAITMMLIIAGINAMANAIDGRMTQLLETKAEASLAKGVLVGLQANPEINVAAPVDSETKP